MFCLLNTHTLNLLSLRHSPHLTCHLILYKLVAMFPSRDLSLSHIFFFGGQASRGVATLFNIHHAIINCLRYSADGWGPCRRPSQCDAARQGARVFGQEVLTPEAQLAVSREYLAIFFLAQLGGGYNGVPIDVVREARRRMWGDASWTAGTSSTSSRVRREDVKLVAEPEEMMNDAAAGGGRDVVGGAASALLPPDVTLSTDPRMSRVEVMM